MTLINYIVPKGYAESARLHGAVFAIGTEVISACFVQGDEEADRTVRGGLEEAGKYWLLETRTKSPVNENYIQKEMRCKTVINCAGLHGDEVEGFRLRGVNGYLGKQSRDDVCLPFTVTPRKGQFVVYTPRPEDVEAGKIPTHVIEPVPTARTKGVIIWKTVYGNVVVGPTAEDQTSKTDRSNDHSTIRMLQEFGMHHIPALENATVVGTYSGLRPSTEYRDYQIHARPGEAWITVGGIRSTGLTASSGIGSIASC